jgi:KDO2-lipid IV(A) lauroyltransferase
LLRGRQFTSSRGSTAIATALVDLSRTGGRIVPLSLANKITLPFSDLVFHFAARQQAFAVANFSHVLGLPSSHPVVQHTARSSFRHFGRFVAESIHAQSWGTEDMQDRVDIEGAEHLDHAAALDKGVIFVSAHMGATDIAAAVAVLRGFRVTAIIEQVRPEWLMDCVLISRQRMGISLIPSAGAGISLIRELRRGGMIAFAVDAGIDRPDSIPIRFFGRDTLPRRSGAPRPPHRHPHRLRRRR